METSKQKILADTKKYVCGKVTRELVKGSIEERDLETLRRAIEMEKEAKEIKKKVGGIEENKAKN